MTRRAAGAWVAMVAAAFGFVGCARTPDPGDPIAGLSRKERARFERGRAEFERVFTPETGLGPLFNAEACAECHENPDKPQFNLATRPYTVPLFSTKKNDVVTMGQKINEMLTGKSKGKELELGSTDIVALEAYILSLRAK